jgi:hypothetical protein
VGFGLVLTGFGVDSGYFGLGDMGVGAAAVDSGLV